MAAATSAGELAEAMAEGNNAARLAGAGMDWYAAILATTIDATQMGATRVGNAFKTMFARYSNIKAGKFQATEAEKMSDTYSEEEFENLNDVAKVLGTIGISIQEGNDFKGIQEVFDEIIAKWEDLNEIQKNAIATVRMLRIFSNEYRTRT